MAFTDVSNGACNHRPEVTGTIPPMHESMARLYQAARQLRGIEGQTRLADALNESPQTVNNWENRGISAIGALEAQREFGLDATWVLTGEGHMTLGLPVSAEVRDRVAELDAASLQRLENVIRAHIGLPVLNPDTSTPAAPRLRGTPSNQNVRKFGRRNGEPSGNKG